MWVGVGNPAPNNLCKFNRTACGCGVDLRWWTEGIRFVVQTCQGFVGIRKVDWPGSVATRTEEVCPQWWFNDLERNPVKPTYIFGANKYAKGCICVVVLQSWESGGLEQICTGLGPLSHPPLTITHRKKFARRTLYLLQKERTDFEQESKQRPGSNLNLAITQVCIHWDGNFQWTIVSTKMAFNKTTGRSVNL